MKPRPRVYVEVGNTLPRAAGKAITDLLQRLGADPFLAPPSHGDLQVSWEELMEFDPQVVIYAVEGKGLAVDPADFLKIEGWDRTEAAMKRQVFSVDDGALSHPAEAEALLAALLKELFEGGPALGCEALRRLS
jgi:ABC-type Fe3+-hydroxamate transport system substrate-binding protein